MFLLNSFFPDEIQMLAYKHMVYVSQLLKSWDTSKDWIFLCIYFARLCAVVCAMALFWHFYCFFGDRTELYVREFESVLSGCDWPFPFRHCLVQ